MKRMFIFSVVISLLLVISSAVAAAPETGAPYGKSFYSSRPNRVLRTFSEDSPTFAPVTDQVPARPNTEPQLTPPTFDKLLDNQIPPNKTLSDFSDFSSTVPILAPPNRVDQPNQSILPATEKITEIRPLSKIDANPTSAVKAERTEVYKKTDESFSSNFLSRTTSSNQPVIEEDKNKQENQLDELNARLAKIQLEKHNLNETFKLIDKIKSPAIKARTLVDLAEYVSRDSNYKKEADQLYALAVDGIDALRRGEAIVIKIRDDLKTESVASSPIVNTNPPATTLFTEPKKPLESTPITTSTSTTTSTAAPRKPALTLLEEEKPVGTSTPKTESVLKTLQKPNESLPEALPKTPEISITTSSDSAISSTPNSSSASTPVVKKSPILLDDEPEKKQTSEDKINVIEKETTSSPTPTKRPTILLGDEPETPKKEKPEAIKLPPTRKPPILLSEEPSVTEEKEIEKNITENPKTETVKKEEPEI
ncbi:MAG: hypothetical protein LBC20_15115, partial [Planctomycetaceae bacterium]|nr:hypothetical protein [Planctomycetaceae bacterium]